MFVWPTIQLESGFVRALFTLQNHTVIVSRFRRRRNNDDTLPSSKETKQRDYHCQWIVRNQLAALAKQQLYDEVCPSHPGFVPDDKSPEDVIKDIQTAQYEADKIATWKGINAEPSNFNRDQSRVEYSLFRTT